MCTHTCMRENIILVELSLLVIFLNVYVEMQHLLMVIWNYNVFKELYHNTRFMKDYMTLQYCYRVMLDLWYFIMIMLYCDIYFDFIMLNYIYINGYVVLSHSSLFMLNYYNFWLLCYNMKLIRVMLDFDIIWLYLLQCWYYFTHVNLLHFSMVVSYCDIH